MNLIFQILILWNDLHILIGNIDHAVRLCDVHQRIFANIIRALSHQQSFVVKCLEMILFYLAATSICELYWLARIFANSAMRSLRSLDFFNHSGASLISISCLLLITEFKFICLWAKYFLSDFNIAWTNEEVLAFFKLWFPQILPSQKRTILGSWGGFTVIFTHRLFEFDTIKELTHSSCIPLCWLWRYSITVG